MKFGRETDLEPHKATSRKYNSTSGPACTEPGYKHPGRFTRVDNFRAHYRKQHKKTNEEAAAFIEEWRAQG
ncbi:hypothetical protein HOY80DRAFT_271903 [Tuber brumale]|nr:hypothetical protein HOY80DRAFT_271903 [Tuber brumale]